MSASIAGSDAAAASAAQLPFEDWASTQRLRALRDGAWKIRCEEHYAAGVVTRSVSTWHHAEPDIAGRRKSQRTGRAPRRSRAARRQSRASALGAPLGQQAQRGSSSPASPKLPKQNARQRRSAQRSAEHHKALAAAASAPATASTAATTANNAATAPSSPSKRDRGDDEPALSELPLVPGGVVPAAGALPQRPRKGLRAGFLLGLLVPFGLMFT